MKLTSIPTIQANGMGQYFLSYFDPVLVIAIVPILEARHGSWYEAGARIHLTNGVVIETNQRPSYIAAALDQAREEVAQ